VLYPAIGLGALILTVAAAVAYRLDRGASSSGAIPIYGAALLAILAFLVTTQVLAPATLHLQQLGNDADVARRVFAATAPWWVLKGLLHTLTFVANLWALLAVLPAAPSVRVPLQGAPL
jgi:hypothetical protein